MRSYTSRVQGVTLERTYWLDNFAQSKVAFRRLHILLGELERSLFISDDKAAVSVLSRRRSGKISDTKTRAMSACPRAAESFSRRALNFSSMWRVERATEHTSMLPSSNMKSTSSRSPVAIDHAYLSRGDRRRPDFGISRSLS